MPNHLRLLPVCALILTAIPLYADDAEDQAVKFIHELGGEVVRDDKDAAKPVVKVDLAGTPLTNAGLKELAGLKALKTLSLSHTQVTDAGMKELAGLTALESLDHSHTVVTSRITKALAGFKRLRTLNLSECDFISGYFGLEGLADLKGLRSLNVNATYLQGNGLMGLANLKNVQTLEVSGAMDEELKEVGALKGLRTLNISGSSRVSDAGLKELTGLKGLQTLNLRMTEVTDAGLKELAALDGLQSLNISNCQRLTGAGLKELVDLKALQTLTLGGGVTEAGMKNLAGLKGLRTLNVSVTDGTLRALREIGLLYALSQAEAGVIPPQTNSDFLNNNAMVGAGQWPGRDGVKRPATIADVWRLNLGGNPGDGRGTEGISRHEGAANAGPI